MMGLPGMGPNQIGQSIGQMTGQNIQQQMNEAGLSTPMGRNTWAGNTLNQSMGQTGQGQALPHNFLQAQVPAGFSMAPGQAVWAKVLNFSKGFATLQMGNFNLTARTETPLTPGQNIQLSFEGTRLGQLEFKLMSVASFTRMTEADLSTALSQMNTPADPKNMQVARGMVEFGIPLTPKNFADVSRALAQLPGPANTTDMAACSFLKMCNLPITSANVQLLSKFFAQNPALGNQLNELFTFYNRDFKKTINKTGDRNREILKELGEVKNRLKVSPAQRDQEGMGKQLKRLTREGGIERAEYRGGSRNDAEDLQELSLLTRRLATEARAETGERRAVFQKASEMVRGMEENFMAQQLINRGRPGGDLAFYFFQVPLELERELVTAEIRIKYYEQEEGAIVDPENTKIEFDVTTEKLGHMHFILKIARGVVHLDVGAQTERACNFIEGNLDTVMGMIGDLGFALGGMRVGFVDEMEMSSFFKRENFDALEKVNNSA